MRRVHVNVNGVEQLIVCKTVVWAAGVAASPLGKLLAKACALPTERVLIEPGVLPLSLIYQSPGSNIFQRCTQAGYRRQSPGSMDEVMQHICTSCEDDTDAKAVTIHISD